MIKRWAEQWPECNWGILTGSTSGVVVLDIDPRNDGNNTLEELEQQYSALPKTPMVLTGGGGIHYYFKYPESILPKKTNLWPGIDLQAEGAFAVGPGSTHASGKHYEWEVEHHPDDITFTELPAWILKAAKVKNTNNTENNEFPDVIPEGSRNNTLTSLAGSMRAQGWGEADISAALWVVNQEKCTPPLPEDEVKGIAASMMRYEPKCAESDKEKEPRKSQADLLIEAAEGATLFHDEHKDPCAIFWVNDHNELYRLKDTGFKHWLRRQYYEKTGKAANNESMTQVINLLEAKAVYDGPQYTLSLRVAERNNAFYYDLADKLWQAVRITPKGWEYLQAPFGKVKKSAHPKTAVECG